MLRTIVNRILRRGRLGIDIDEASIRDLLRAAYPEAAMPDTLAERVERGMAAAGTDVGEVVRDAHPRVAMSPALQSRIVRGMAEKARPAPSRRPVRVRLVVQYGAAMALVAVSLGLTMHLAVMHLSGPDTRAQDDTEIAAAPSESDVLAAGRDAEPSLEPPRGAEPTRGRQDAGVQEGVALAGEAPVGLPHGAASRPSMEPPGQTRSTTEEQKKGMRAHVSVGKEGFDFRDEDASTADVLDMAGVLVRDGVVVDVDRSGLVLGSEIASERVELGLGATPALGGAGMAGPGAPGSRPAGQVVVVAFEPESGSVWGDKTADGRSVSRFYAEVADAASNSVTVSAAEEGESVSIHTARYNWDRRGVRPVAGRAVAGQETAPADREGKRDRKERSNEAGE